MTRLIIAIAQIFFISLVALTVQANNIYADLLPRIKLFFIRWNKTVFNVFSLHYRKVLKRFFKIPVRIITH